MLGIGLAGCAMQDDATTYAPAPAPAVGDSSFETLSMQVLADGVGWAADRSHVLWTRDNGEQWTDVTPVDLGAGHVERVFFRTEREGWLVTSSDTGETLTARRTQDGGASWTNQPLVTLPGGGAPVSMEFTDEDHGWVMVRLSSSANFSPGLLLATTDGGQSWTALPDPPVGGEIHFTSRDTGWLAGGPAGDQLYVTRDGGQRWERQAVSPPSAADRGTSAIYQLPTFRGAEGILPVRFTSPASSRSLLATYATSDGGATWRGPTLVTGPDAADLDAGGIASVVDADTVIVAPGSSTDLVVMAGAAQRHYRRSVSASSQQAIVGMDFQTAERGWLVLASGQCAGEKSLCRQVTKLFTTSDGGRTLRDITPAVAAPAPGATASRISLTTGKGFDKCAVGTVSQMQAWWTNTPWSWANVYIGGTNRGCSQPGLTAGWVSSVFAQGWRLVPTWVGLQAPGSSCTGCSKMSTSATTARQQGINEANAAADAVAALGFPAPTVIYFDMERYDPTTHPAVKAFINAWVERLAQRGHQAGVYGAGVNATNDWAPIANPPQAVWIAQWNNVDGVFGLSGLSNSLWANHQRIHQFQGPHNETWGGVTFNIDSDRADGPVADN